MQNDVIDAIKKRHEVDITYGNSANGRRRIQPVVYGTSTKGNPMIRAYQPYGDTESRVPSWKLFKLDKITGWKTLPDKTFGEPPAYDPHDEKFATIYVSAQFEGGAEDNMEYGMPEPQYKQGSYQPKQEPVEYQPITRPQYSNIAGVSTQNTSNGNQDSIRDMASVGKIGDNVTQPTTQPYVKDTVDVGGEDNEMSANDYDEAAKNGPVTKNQNVSQEDKEENTEY